MVSTTMIEDAEIIAPFDLDEDITLVKAAYYIYIAVHTLYSN
jgi:hypothetical protein